MRRAASAVSSISSKGGPAARARALLGHDPRGEPIAGNIASLPPDILAHPGLVEMAYQPPGDTGGQHRALVRIFVLDGGFHLLVGHDLEEGESLRHILGDALLTSLVWLVVIGTLGGLWVARRVLNRVDAINANARAIVAGDLSGRLHLAGTGDELDRLVQISTPCSSGSPY